MGEDSKMQITKILHQTLSWVLWKCKLKSKSRFLNLQWNENGYYNIQNVNSIHGYCSKWLEIKKKGNAQAFKCAENIKLNNGCCQ